MPIGEGVGAAEFVNFACVAEDAAITCLVANPLGTLGAGGVEQAGHGFGAQAGFQVGAWCVGGGEAGQLQVVGGVEIDADAAGVDGGEALVTCAAVEGDGAGLLNGFTAAPCTTAFAMAAGVFGHGHELAAMRVENKAMGYVHGRK